MSQQKSLKPQLFLHFSRYFHQNFKIFWHYMMWVILYLGHDWILFAGVIALFMFGQILWPYSAFSFKPIFIQFSGCCFHQMTKVLLFGGDYWSPFAGMMTLCQSQPYQYQEVFSLQLLLQVLRNFHQSFKRLFSPHDVDNIRSGVIPFCQSYGFVVKSCGRNPSFIFFK